MNVKRILPLMLLATAAWVSVVSAQPAPPPDQTQPPAYNPPSADQAPADQAPPAYNPQQPPPDQTPPPAYNPPPPPDAQGGMQPPAYNPPPPDQQGGYPPPGDQGAPPPPNGPGNYPPPPGYPGAPPAYQGGYAGQPGGDQADVSQFYDQMSPYGQWVQNPQYGWVWIPSGVAAGWQPYVDGHWVYTDAGWAWVSDEPWGWAAYHYGRWYDDSTYGWAWVPGVQWAPAWVAWRSGGGYIGWAPLPPVIGWRAGIGLQVGGVNLDVAIAPAAYCFVSEREILAPQVREVLVPRGRNFTIIRATANITSYTVVNNRVVNRGVPVDHVEQVLGRRITPVRIAAATSPREAREAGGAVAFYRPTIQPRRGSGVPVPGARLAPPPRGAAPAVSAEDLGRRHETEQRALDAYHQGERQRLLDTQKSEMARQRDQAGRDSLARQHASELQALEKQQQRERGALAARQQHERQSAPPRREPPHR